MVSTKPKLRSSDEKVFKALTYIIVTISALACLLPFLRVVSEAFSSDTHVASGDILFWPRGFTLKQMRFILETRQFTHAMWVSISSTAVFTVLSMVLTTLLAFPLSRKYLPKSNALMFYVTFTMLFNGGIVPTYMVVKALKLTNTFWAIIIPEVISQYNVIIMVTAFRAIPKEYEEAAWIEGAGNLTVLTRIMLPLCKPTMAALLLFYAVGRWNRWFDVVMYVNERELYTLPVVIRDIIRSGLSSLYHSLVSPPPTAAVQSAAVIFSIAPIILLYPFLQKYFVKGITLGGIKG